MDKEFLQIFCPCEFPPSVKNIFLWLCWFWIATALIVVYFEIMSSNYLLAAKI